MNRSHIYAILIGLVCLLSLSGVVVYAITPNEIVKTADYQCGDPGICINWCYGKFWDAHVYTNVGIWDNPGKCYMTSAFDFTRFSNITSLVEETKVTGRMYNEGLNLTTITFSPGFTDPVWHNSYTSATHSGYSYYSNNPVGTPITIHIQIVREWVNITAKSPENSRYNLIVSGVDMEGSHSLYNVSVIDWSV